MAQFNPTINPTNDPSYTNVTHPISIPDSINPQGVAQNQIMPQGQQIGDKSAEYLGKAKAYAAESEGVSQKGFTDLFAGIVGIGDFLGKAGVQMVRKDIEDKVYQVADSERQLYTQRLEELKNNPSVKNIISNDGSEGSTPGEISSLPDQLEVLRSAKDGGKLSSTDYNARLLAAAKDLRARYPGFKQEIDAEFAKVTGHNPANAYITGLVADINRQGASHNTEVNKLQTYITNNPGFFDDPVSAIQKVQTGEWTRADVVRQAAPHEKLKLNLQERKAVFDDQNISREDKVIRGRELFNAGAEGIVNTYVDKLMTKMGLTTAQDVVNLNTRSKNGEISSKHWAELGQMIANEQIQLRQAIYNDARKQGLTSALGADEVNKLTDAAMKRIDVLKDRVYAQDSGGLYAAAKTIKAMSDDDQKNAFQDSVIGPPLRLAEVAKRVGGDQWMANEALRQATDGLVGKWTTYAHNMQTAIATQTDMETSGIPLTLNRVFDEYGQRMKDASASEKRKINAATIGKITDIADPKTPEAVKLNYAAAAFSPQNRGFISRLNADSVDDKGRQIEGQNAVFQKLTSPEMTKEMKRLGATNPKVWENYVNWTTETLGNELIYKDMTNLSQVRNPNIQVGWDSDNKRLIASYKTPSQYDMKRGVPYQPVNDPEWISTQRAVNAINSNLSNYKNVAEASGQNVDAFMLNSIAQTLGPQALQNVDNLPAQIVRQLGLTKLKNNSRLEH